MLLSFGVICFVEIVATTLEKAVPPAPHSDICEKFFRMNTMTHGNDRNGIQEDCGNNASNILHL